MIRKVLLASVALVAIAGTAVAADLPTRRAPPVFIPPPVPVFSWTGFYIGGQVGYAFGGEKANYSVTGTNIGVGNFVIGHPDGVIGGVHGGYNFSTQGFGGGPGGGLILGIEADVDGSDYRAIQPLLSTTVGPLGVNFNQRIRNDIQGSVRGRLGIAVDRALFYVTGGVAVADFRNNYTLTITGAPIGLSALDEFSHTRIGYTVGGGVEYALTTNFSLRGEYRYSDYGRFTDVLANSTAGLLSVSNRNIQQRAQIGFSYKLDNPVAAPIVARY